MVTLVRIPKPSANVEQVTVMKWMAETGRTVTRGMPLLEASTEKNAIEIEAPADGVLRRQLAAEKSVLPTGYIVAIIAESEETLPDVEAENRAMLQQTLQDEPRQTTTGRPTHPARRRQRVRATPAARRLARELGLELASVAGGGAADVVSVADVRRFADRRSKEEDPK